MQVPCTDRFCAAWAQVKHYESTVERLSGELGTRGTEQEQLQGEADALRRQLEETHRELAEAEEKVYSSIGDYKVSDS